MLDAHCHVDLYSDPYGTAVKAERHRVYTLAVTRLPSHFPEAHRQLTGFRYVRPALGYHPQLVHDNFTEMGLLKGLLHATRYIGEVGLDFTCREGIERERQVEAFDYVLRLARSQDKVFTVHSRRAESRVLEMLLQHDCRKAIFHWYSGPLNLLSEIVAHGYYLSVNSRMLTTERGRRIVESLPTDRVLTETDGPFIKLGHRTIEPVDVRETTASLAELWGVDEQRAARIVLDNFKRLLTEKTVSASHPRDQAAPLLFRSRRLTAS